MATHSRVLAWRIPGMGEPGGLLSMGSHRVGHWSDLAAVAAALMQSLGSRLILPHASIHLPPTHPRKFRNCQLSSPVPSFALRGKKKLSSLVLENGQGLAGFGRRMKGRTLLGWATKQKTVEKGEGWERERMDGSSKRSQGWMRDSRPGGMQEKWGLDLRSVAGGSCSSGDRSKVWSSLHTLVWILNCTSVNVVPSRTKKFQCTTNLRAKGTVPLGFY